MQVFNNIDTYIFFADAAICSTECPCNINNRVPWETVPDFANTVRTWNIDTLDGVTAFQFCPLPVQRNVYTRSAESNIFFDPVQDFNTANFWDYMGRIERKFNCVGWCGLRYVHPTTGVATPLTKYIFSDVNR